MLAVGHESGLLSTGDWWTKDFAHCGRDQSAKPHPVNPWNLHKFVVSVIGEHSL